MTGGRCSLLVRVPAPLTVNITLHSLVGAGVSSERDHGARSAVRAPRCPLELLVVDGSRRHTRPEIHQKYRQQKYTPFRISSRLSLLHPPMVVACLGCLGGRVTPSHQPEIRQKYTRITPPQRPRSPVHWRYSTHLPILCPHQLRLSDGRKATGRAGHAVTAVPCVHSVSTASATFISRMTARYDSINELCIG